MAITKVINDAVDLNQTTDYSGLRLPVGTTGNVVESFTADYLVVGGGGTGGLRVSTSNYGGAGGAGGLRTSYNNSTTTTNTLSFPSGKTAIATYMLDNNATDVSENYDGGEYNITYNTGQYGGAAVFNVSSSSTITLPTGSPFNDSNTIKAISAWVKRSGSGEIRLFSVSDTGSNFIGVSILSTGLYFIARNGSSSNQLNARSLQSIDNNWHHVAIVYDASGIKWYLDGQEQTVTYTTTGTATNSSWISYPSYSGTPIAYIGKSRQNGPSYSDGLIDQVRIYDTALSSTDVTNIYNNEVQANSGGGTAAESSLTLQVGTAYDVTVGAGVAGQDSNNRGNNGGDSTFSTITSIGGGGGGSQANIPAGKTGGSGGGGAYNSPSSSGGNGTTGQGYSGGDGYAGPNSSGGGGGAGGTGGTQLSNNGGVGLAVNILNSTNAGTASVGEVSGSNVYYAGGGGGTSQIGDPTATGGLGGGGDGSVYTGTAQTPGAANTGGGGGGGGINKAGQTGGSGVVILRYPTASISSFTTTGTLNTPSTTDTIADTAYPVANTAYYKLDNSAIDLSGSTGKFDQAGVFNGSSSYIALGANTPLNNFNGEQTISAWIYPTTAIQQSIIGYRDDSTLKWNYFRMNSNRTLSFLLRDSSSISGATTVGLINLNAWNHVCVTIDSSNINFYINGGTAEAFSNSVSSFTSSEPTDIGRRGSYSDQYFNGSIDQVRLYNVALSSTDVTALYNETVSTTGQLNFPSGQTAIATYELNGNANGILTTTDLSTVNYPAGAGCIALYEMNETADDTSGVYNGTPSNIDYNFGAFGQAAVFNGSSSDIFNSNRSATQTDTISISAWIKTSDTSTSMMIVQTESIWVRSDYILRHDNYNGTGNYRRYNYTQSTVATGVWVHVCVVRDGTSVTLYVNNSPITFDSESTSSNSGVYDGISIGARNRSSDSNKTSHFDGSIDQVRIFNTALTQAQVTTLARGIGTSYSGVDTNVLYAYNGTPTNVTYENGRFGQAAIFNGSSSRITLPIGSPFNDSNTIKAVSAWIKAGTSTSRVYPLSISSTSNASDYWYIGYMGDLNAIYVATRDGSSSNQSIAYATITPDTGWHHIVAQLTATGKEIYLDGISQTVINSNSGTGTNTSWISYPSYSGTVQGVIGILRLSSPQYSDGSIDQVRIFETALSSTQITQLYNEHYQTQFTEGSDTAILFTEGTGTVTFSGIDPAPPQGALRANTSYSEDGSGSVIEHYNGTDWKYFDAVKYCTTNTLNFPSGAGCIASYNLDNNIDDIGNTYNGVNSNVTFTASGKFGAAAVFNGSNARIDISNVLSGFTNVYTFSIWAKIDNTNNFSFFSSTASTAQSTYNNLIRFALHQNGNYYFSFGDIYGGRLTGASPSSWRDGNWHNFVFVSTSTQKLAYVDGSLFDSTSSTKAVSGLTNIILGHYGTNYADGLIDQVRIFNDSLTSDEVSKLYNNEVACS
jgi:hypothetical protein